MQTQLDIPLDLNKKLKIFRIENNLKNLEATIILILSEFFKGQEGDYLE